MLPGGSSHEMKTFGWLTRVKYGLLAAVAGWSAGWLVSFPFKLSLAWRYVDGDFRRLPISLAKGLLVWAGFSLFMAMAGFLPLVLPSVVLIPPGWIVRWRGFLIPAAPLAASLLIYRRMGLLNLYHFRNPSVCAVSSFFPPLIFLSSHSPWWWCGRTWCWPGGGWRKVDLTVDDTPYQ